MVKPKVKNGKKKGGPIKLVPKVKELVFDDEKRAEYLTGFSKRKQERKNAARLKAMRREREERLEERRLLREHRKERIETNLRNAREVYGDEFDINHPQESASSSESDAEIEERTFSNDENVAQVVISSLDDQETEVNLDQYILPENNTHVDSDAGGNDEILLRQMKSKQVKKSTQYKPKLTKDQKKKRTKKDRKREQRA